MYMEKVRKLIKDCTSDFTDQKIGRKYSISNVYMEMDRLKSSLDLTDDEMLIQLPGILHTTENNIGYLKDSAHIRRDDPDAVRAMQTINSIRITAGFMCMNNVRLLLENCTSKFKIDIYKTSAYANMNSLKFLLHMTDDFISRNCQSQLKITEKNISHYAALGHVTAADAAIAQQTINDIFVALSIENRKGNTELSRLRQMRAKLDRF